MKTRLLPLLLATLLLALAPACQTPPPEVPCTCGTAMADLEGCAHPACVAGRTNPDNPACVCGRLEIPNAKKD